MNVNYPKFSVLMSLYIKEKAEYFEECIKSILNQTVLPAEIVIVFDGPISEELLKVVNDYQSKYSNIIKLIKNEQNKGLGLALADGIPQCSYNLIARMDTDDIARSDRFEKQLLEFIKDPSLDICGSHIIEFDGDISNTVSKRKVPLKHNEIAEYQKRRDAFNHVTVMYKKSAVLKAGNYIDVPLMEDTSLWVRMLICGAKCMNIDDYLVYVRVGMSMIKRRGGWDYLKKYRKARKQILQTGYISYWDYIITIIVQLVVSLIPQKVRLIIFTKLLREKIK